MTLTEETFQTRVLRGVDSLVEKHKTLKQDHDNLRSIIADLQEKVLNSNKAGVARFQPGSPVTGDSVSDACAEYIAALGILGAEKRGQLVALTGSNHDNLLKRAESIARVSQRTSLTSSDIPLPTEYSGEVVALVSKYGAARKYGTVFPLGTGVTKLPRLKTSPAFGLLAQSTAITEKSPQTEWVTFTAEKFGGLVRYPSEIDEDSIVPMGKFIADYAAREIAQVEDQVFFLNLDGSTYGAVKGLCGSTITNSKVLQLTSTKTHYSDVTIADIANLRSVPDAAALGNSAYYMHHSFEPALSAANTSGNRRYNPNAQLATADKAQPFITGPTFDGFPIRWVDVMPAYSTSANASKVFMLFGNLKYQFLGTVRNIRIETSPDAGFETDEILIRALERFTIGLMATGAVGGLQTSGS